MKNEIEFWFSAHKNGKKVFKMNNSLFFTDQNFTSDYLDEKITIWANTIFKYFLKDEEIDEHEYGWKRI